MYCVFMTDFTDIHYGDYKDNKIRLLVIKRYNPIK